MHKFKSLTLIVTILIVIIISGCSIKFNGGSDSSSGNDLGIFITTNQGDIWKQSVLISTTSGSPKSIGTLSVNYLAIDPGDSSAIYFGSVGNGLFYSYDKASSWFPAAGLAGMTIMAVAVDPGSKCIVYVASGNKVFKSVDCNRTYEQTYFDNDLKVTVNAIAIDHFNSKNVYLGTSRGEIIKSYNQGVSWQTLSRFKDKVERIFINPNDSRIMFAATTGKGIHRSKNGGVNWTDLNKALEEFKDSRDFKDFTFVSGEPGLVFLATSYGLLRSSDLGDNWEKIELIPPEHKTTINAITVNPQNGEEIYYVTDTTFYRTKDGGQSWITKKLPTTQAGSKLLIDPENPNIIYLGVRSLKR